MIGNGVAGNGKHPSSQTFYIFHFVLPRFSFYKNILQYILGNLTIIHLPFNEVEELQPVSLPDICCRHNYGIMYKTENIENRRRDVRKSPSTNRIMAQVVILKIF